MPRLSAKSQQMRQPSKIARQQNIYINESFISADRIMSTANLNFAVVYKHISCKSKYFDNIRVFNLQSSELFDYSLQWEFYSFNFSQ